MFRTLTVFLVFLNLVCVNISCSASTDPANTSEAAQATALLSQYHQVKAELANSVFGSPILLNSDIGDDYAKGVVYALLETPFAALGEALSQPAQWCDLAILHINIKTCIYHQNQVNFYVGRKYYQTPDQAYVLQYRFERLINNKRQLNIKLTAPKGPLGTFDYLINLQAIPIDEQHSFIRFEYRYRFGLIANLAMQSYLATLGRNKVGFTKIGIDENAEPIYIKGLQGVIERNVMRYIFAIQSVLEASNSLAENRRATQLAHWYAHIKKYPRQLVELTREEYLNNKQREIDNQIAMQKTSLP